MKCSLSVIAALGFALLLAACGGGGDSQPEKPAAKITLVSPQENTFSLSDGAITVALSGSTSSSPRNDVLSYQWELIAKPAHSNAQLNSADSLDTRFDVDIPGSYVVSLMVNDGTATSDPVRITLVANSPYPVAITPAQHSVSLGADRVGLDGSASLVPSGTTGQLSYLWRLVSEPDGSSPYLDNADQAMATLYLDIAGDYRLELIVSYDGVDSKPAEVLVTVSSGNAPPVARATDITVKRGDVVTLDGSASYDPEGESLEYRWRLVSAPKNVPQPDLTNSKAAQASFIPTVVGEYTLELFVFDGVWKSNIQSVKVTVEKPEGAEPLSPVGELVATGYSPSSSIGEQEVGLRANFSFIGYDPDGLPLQIVDAEIVEKPANSLATLQPIGNWEPLGRKIQKLDQLGTYRVRMTLSNGISEIVREASMEAKVGGINNRPSTGGVTAQRPSVIVGEPLIFDVSSSDKDGDPLSFKWELTDQPNNSKAELEPMLDEETQEYRRARVLTDVPGSYSVRVTVTDDRGLSGVSPAERTAFAKLSNAAPEIRNVVWTRNWGRLRPNENYFQLLPCMSVLLRPVIVDLDGDEVDYYEEMVASPEGGSLTSSNSAKAEDCSGYRGQVFTKPGTYKLRYLASDGMDTSEPYDFNVQVESPDNARGVILKNVAADSVLMYPMPHENIPAFGYGRSGIRPTTGLRINWSLEAMDGDYTIEDVKTAHINGGLTSLTPSFDNLIEGHVIRQGETLNFATVVPPVLCTRNDDETEGFHFSFRIKELPGMHFIHEDWQSTSQGLVSEWPMCQPGEVE